MFSGECKIGQNYLDGLCCNKNQVNDNGTCVGECSDWKINLNGICSSCESGKIPNTRQTACVCPDDQIMESQKCQLCKDGKIPSSDQKSCNCPEGQIFSLYQYSVFGQIIEKYKCQNCQAGKVPNEDQTKCVAVNNG